MKKLFFVSMFLIFSHVSIVEAAPYDHRAASKHSMADHPAVILKDKLTRIHKFMADGSEHDPATVLRFLQDEIADTFQLERMARWIAGPYYVRMGVENQAKYQNRLKEKILTAISRQLGIFSNQQTRMTFYPPYRTGRSEVAVSVRIGHPRQPPAKLTFRFHFSQSEGWKVYDVSINGSSALVYFRNYYRQSVGQYGPQAFIR